MSKRFFVKGIEDHQGLVTNLLRRVEVFDSVSAIIIVSVLDNTIVLICVVYEEERHAYIAHFYDIAQNRNACPVQSPSIFMSLFFAIVRNFMSNDMLCVMNRLY
jgi:hypothetical protein